MEPQPADNEKAAQDFEPKIVALVCTYCTYTAADTAGSMRLSYPVNVRVVKYLCTGKVDIIHILKAFEAGADLVFVSGCEIGDCHFLEGNLRAKERVEFAKHLYNVKESVYEAMVRDAIEMGNAYRSDELIFNRYKAIAVKFGELLFGKYVPREEGK